MDIDELDFELEISLDGDIYDFKIATYWIIKAGNTFQHKYFHIEQTDDNSFKLIGKLENISVTRPFIFKITLIGPNGSCELTTLDADGTSLKPATNPKVTVDEPLSIKI